MRVEAADEDLVPGAPAAPRARPDPWPRIVVAVGIVGYVVLFCQWTFRNHDGFATYGFDFGIYDQGLWLLSRFHAPFITIMGRNLFGDHTSLILLPLVPVYWVFPNPKVLLFAQSAALGMGALPVFLLGRDKLREEWPAAALAVAFLAVPALGWANMEQFHPDVFEVPLVLFAFLFVTRRRWVAYFVCLGLLLLVKEDVALLTLPLGVYVAVRHDRRVGLATCAVSVLYFLVAVYWVLPELNGVGTLNRWRIPFGGPRGVIETAIFHPGRFWSYVWSDDRPFYVWQLVAPTALVALLLAPDVALVASGPLASNVLSNFWYQYHLQYGHYGTSILAVLAVATVFGVARVRRRRLRLGAVAVVTVAALTSGWLWGPATVARRPSILSDPGWPGFRSVRQAIALVPDDAVVSAFYPYVTHLEHRRQVYEFPVPWRAHNWGTFTQEDQRLPEADEVTYVLVPTTLDDEKSRAVLRAIRPDFESVYRSADVELLRRRR